ncbi:O-antigen translocase [Solitalea longa]|uniref:O-antigen translocase n=1 Tax=Solitalea longa TaxID=2079460 RepID=A0A2S4ZY55_9SPHI|nr:O-antigen translocase [Solitalea longa]
MKTVLNKDITKVFSQNAMATLVRILTGFVSVKTVAIIIGPAGVALLGQLNNFSTIFLTLSTGGINTGVTKYVAENAGSQKKINVFLRTALWITLVLSLLCALILVGGSAYFTRIILKDIKYQSVIIVFGITIFLYALNAILLSVLNGYKQYKKYVWVNISGSLVSLLFSTSLAYYYNIYGALLAAVTYQSVVFVVTVFFAIRCNWFSRKNFLGRFSKTAGKKLASYSLMAIISAAIVPVSQLIIRGYMVNHTSLEEAGIWEGMNRISSMYLMVITSSLAIYYLPRMAEIKTDWEMRREIFSAYKLIVPPLLIATVCIYLFRHFIIHALFNKAFTAMEHLFAFQLLGDFFKICSWLLGYQIVAKSMTKLFIITEVLFSLSLVGLSALFINIYSNMGATIGYALNYLMHFIVMLIVFRKLIFSKS